ncbi:MAG TPA: BACON domain-containing carbohydrate-binding protein, partial [Pirellulales bacterium]
MDTSGNLYVANSGTNTVSKFAPGGTAASATYSAGISTPDAVAFDTSGNLYVANHGNNTVSRFAPGSTTASATYSSGLSSPNFLAFDSSGNLYVASSGNNTVVKYLSGSTAVSATYPASSGISNPDGLAFDSSGNLYVASSANNAVVKFGPGSTAAIATYSTGASDPFALVLDPSGNLYVANDGTNTISKFAAGTTSVSATYSSGVSGPWALALDTYGNLYVANSTSSSVSEFIPGSTAASATYSSGISTPHGILFDASGNMYVANNGNSTVSKFTFTATMPTAGGVVIQSTVESRPMSIGGTNNAAVAGINLTNAELAQIATISGGTLTIGDSQQTGNITFATATPATTSGEQVLALQSFAGPGTIILDDGGGTATALAGNGANLILGAGAGGIQALSASNATAEIATTGNLVTLSTIGPIGSSTNRIQFADTLYFGQQDISVTTASSAYIDGLGTLILGNFQGLGPAGTTIDVTARTNLYVYNGITIAAGASTLSLGADLKADETGDDGSGSLVIDPGAIVTSSSSAANAITLRGAYISIDTSSDPAVVGAAPAAAFTGLSTPVGVALDGSGNVYVVNETANTVSVFTGSTTASATLTGLSLPQSLIFDTSGDLFVSNAGNNTVSEFLPGHTTPSFTLGGLSSPGHMIFDSSGNLYVANFSGGTVSRFAKGATTASLTYKGLDEPTGLALDSSGDLFVANFATSTSTYSVSEFKPGITTSTVTLTGVTSPDALAFDSSGNLYVANDLTTGTVSKFLPGATTAGATLTGLTLPQALAFDAHGDLYVSNYLNNTVSKFLPGGTTAAAQLTGLSEPQSLAFDLAGNLAVANLGNNTVTIFAGAAMTPVAGGVVLRNSIESQAIAIGAYTGQAGIYTTAAEMAQIYTTSSGTLTIGDSLETGSINLYQTVPTTPGASLNVVESLTGSGYIGLDDSFGKAVSGSGNVSLTAGTGGVLGFANDTVAEIGITGASVSIITSGPIGSSSNRIQFADNTNTAQQVVSIGSATVQPSSIYLDGLGSLTLGSILGNTATGSGLIDVTARTNLVVAPGATIAGGGNVTLGADMTAAEVGDDGVGTLTISAGAIVTSRSIYYTVLLRGADVNLDASSDPASVGSGPAATLTGVANPFALVFDASGNMYVANYYLGTISKFAPGATTASATLTGLINPVALAFDAAGDLFVANATSPGFVSEFASGSTTATAVLSGLSNPQALAFDSAGDLFVANGGNNTVSKFLPGATTASTALSGLNLPVALAFNSSGNLFVANYNGGTVSEFAAGSLTASTSLTGLSSPGALRFDSSGNLYVANNVAVGSISKFSASSISAGGATISPSAMLTGLSDPYALTFDSSGTLYVSNSGNNTISKFAAGSTAASGVLSGVNTPFGLAFNSAGNLYVANEGSSTVSEFAGGNMSVLSGYLYIYPSVTSRPMSIGGTNNAAVAGINLTNAELADLHATYSLVLGDEQVGTITVTTALMPITQTAEVQITTNGEIILDDGAGSGTALNGNGATLYLYAGSSGIVALSANNNTAEIATTGVSVTLSSAGPIGTSTHRIQFADDASTAQQIVSVSYNSNSSVYLDGLGSLTLSSFGSTAYNETVDVTARTNLVVSGGATISSGSSTLSLGADLKADGTGDDGVGTLTISSGASILSSNTTASAILLRGADVNLATGSGPATVGSLHAFGAYNNPVSLGDDPSALAFDTNGNLYVTGYYGGTVKKFAAGSTTTAAVLTGLTNPDALAFDASGNLYVANYGAGTVSKFTGSSTTASVTLTGLSGPAALAFDSSGDLYVANKTGGTVSMFLPGATTASLVLRGMSQPDALAIDSSGNIYVADYSQGEVLKFAPAQTAASRTYGLYEPDALLLDTHGNLFVAESSYYIYELSASSLSYSAYFYGVYEPYGMALDSAGDLYVADYSQVYEFTPGTPSPVAHYSAPYEPQYVALDKNGNLFVTSPYYGYVTEFPLLAGPGGVTIRSSVESRPIEIGGTNNAAVAGINLTSAELAQISTTSTGTVTIGDSLQTGNITFTTATPATTAGAAVNVVESSSGVGEIILDDNSGAGTGLTDASGPVSLSPGTGGVLTTLYSTGTPLVADGISLSGTLTATLAYATTPGSQITVANDTATPASSNLISGAFSNAAQGGSVVLSYLGNSYPFVASYRGGDGNDLILTEPIFTLGTSALVEGASAGSDTDMLGMTPAGGAWTASSNSSWLHVTGGNASGTGAKTVVFSFDANPAASARAGTLTIAGQTLTVTQAGTSYVAANSVTTLVGSGLNNPIPVAVDSSGNVYFANASSGTVQEWVAATNSVVTLVSSGLSSPKGVAVDASGNVYIADRDHNAIKEWVAATSTVITKVSSGLNSPIGVAVDSSGNIYVSNYAGDTITEWVAATSTVISLASGLNGPAGLSVDGSGNVYFADSNNNLVKEWVAATNSVTTLISSGLNLPQDVAIDGSGNLYIADYNNNAVKEWVAATGSVVTLVSSGLHLPTGVAVDSSGNVYIADSGDNAIKELTRAFVGPATTILGPAAGSAAVQVLPTIENLLNPLAPTSNQSWLTIGTTAGGVINYSFTANTTTAARTADITVLGQQLVVTQAAATFTDTGAALNIALNSSQQVAITSTGTSYQFVLSSGTWTGTNDANVTGNGTSTLTVTSAGISAFTAGIYVVDTGSSGGDAVTFADSQASGYSDIFSVTLAGATPTLSFSGASIFSASLTASIAGAIAINSGASITGGSSPISLASVGTNSNLSIQGNVTTSDGNVLLQATGNVTVGMSATVNSSSGTLTLAADVQSSGAGDDGTGTLSVGA